MAWGRRRRSSGINIWPGFVDAMASLLLVIIFVLLVLVLTQFHLSQALAGRDKTIGDLGQKLAHLAEMLDLEKSRNTDLQGQLGRLQDQISGLETKLSETEGLRQTIASLTGQKADLGKKLRKYIRAYSKSARPFRWTYTGRPLTT